LDESPYRIAEALAMGGTSMPTPTPTPISLTDSQLKLVMDAARPLSPHARDRFLRQVAEAICALPERGDGAIHRAIRSIWRENYDAPDLRTYGPRPRAY
jgi:hypothetical protein